jgi:hypothetical protein
MSIKSFFNALLNPSLHAEEKVILNEFLNYLAGDNIKVNPLEQAIMSNRIIFSRDNLSEMSDERNSPEHYVSNGGQFTIHKIGTFSGDLVYVFGDSSTNWIKGKEADLLTVYTAICYKLNCSTIPVVG